MPTSVPNRDRPEMPEGYGVPEDADGLLEWSEVDRRLYESPVYWLATTRPDGRPHVVPRWGAWLDGRLYYDGSPRTRHVRNLRQEPRCVLHLEDGTNAVIVEGRSGPARPPGAELGGRIAGELGRKYGDKGYRPAADAWEGPDAGGLCVFVPDKALAWTDFPRDVTRFHLRSV